MKEELIRQLHEAIRHVEADEYAVAANLLSDTINDVSGEAERQLWESQVKSKRPQAGEIFEHPASALRAVDRVAADLLEQHAVRNQKFRDTLLNLAERRGVPANWNDGLKFMTVFAARLQGERQTIPEQVWIMIDKLEARVYPQTGSRAQN